MFAESSGNRIIHRRTQYDRFIPNRSAMDMDYAKYMLTEGIKDKENRRPDIISPSSEAYQKHLADSLGMNRTRVLSFKSKPPPPTTPQLDHLFPTSSKKPIRRIPQASEGIKDLPGIIDDYLLNLIDWGNCNVLSIAISDTVFLWDLTRGAASELVTFDSEEGPVTSVKWAPDGRQIAIGLNNSHVQLWDTTTATKIKTLKGGHRSRVAALDWNNNDHMLTTGGMDGRIFNNDVRIPKHIVETYRGHHQEVCGLKWSASGWQLASGGNDSLLHIWDRRSTSSSSVIKALHRLEHHTAAVKALAWCPFQTNLLASGGDTCIKFYDTSTTGACLNSVDTGSQVSSLIWNKNERELLSASGFDLTLWRYPSMVKMAELAEHTSNILYVTQSPDGCNVASAAGDETLRVWNVFGAPAKPAPKKSSEPFAAYLKHIR